MTSEPPERSMAETDLNETANRETDSATTGPPTPLEAFQEATDGSADRAATNGPEPDQAPGFDPAALDEDAGGGYTSDAGSG